MEWVVSEVFDDIEGYFFKWLHFLVQLLHISSDKTELQPLRESIFELSEFPPHFQLVMEVIVE